MHRILLAAVVLVQTAVLVSMTVNQEIILRTSSCFLLEAQVYDPRDIIKGHYIVLSYPAERVQLSSFGGNRPTAGEKIYVELGPGTNEFWVPVRAASTPIAPEAGHQVLAGKVQYLEETEWAESKQNKLADPVVHVDYGIRRFYVNEEKGNPAGRLSAQVVVRRGGRAYLKDLLVDGISIRTP